jgi:hypothetical protein
MQHEVWTLYLASAHLALATESTHVYARDEAHARSLLREWIVRRSDVPIEVRAFPHGFTAGLTSFPGTIKVPVGEEGNDDGQ